MGNAHFIPLLVKDVERPRDYITVNEAVEEGVLEIRDSGVIDRVIAINRGRKPILVVAGMDLHAEGTQSRIILGSHLIPPGAKVELPCRCTHDVHPIRAQAALMTDMEHYAVASPDVRRLALLGEQADQHGVWKEVAEHREKLRSRRFKGKALLSAESSTSRLSAIQEEAAMQLRRELDQVKVDPRQVGLAVISDGEVRALELFDSPETYRKMHRKLIERFALEITAQRGTPREKVQDLMQGILRESSGLSRRLKIDGHTGRVRSGNKTLSTLLDDKNRVVHLCLE